jgi:hypothetical protein
MVLGSRRDTPVATKTIKRITDWSKLLGQRPTDGGSASQRAATCAKPEQAERRLIALGLTTSGGSRDVSVLEFEGQTIEMEKTLGSTVLGKALF